ncbi:GumC family protein [Maridesulfovibrio hydrothermalis]|uniref:Lipopolysaccharide biosynthesis protein n=1 Tax=Maridesulfovibrio hydrothermalis AM13 = DSM 14728 TaxID=1121451 RepID=L0RDI2_9BACT|nr:LPS biosynthesis protein [Maridesulfovibrio hydrothermalis]CCO24828.1 Lipopolysaccharide biosynthesis protein [Maridesulfovibrio hydrothermalis AM13 = DSM 14728]
MQQSSDIAYYIDVLRRRKYQFIIPAGVVFTMVVILAFVLAPVYKSTATILIEDQDIPQELVQTTVTGFVEERLQSISQIVLSHGNLLNIIKEFDLYPDLIGKYTTEEIITKMREDIQLEPITAEITNQYSGRPSSATVAFTLSYEGRRPQKVAQVANVLTSLYLKENLKEREEKARSTFEFLELQLAELRSEILELESQIANFKEGHGNELPELLVHNMNSMERLQRELDKVQEQIASLKNRKVYLEGQRASIDPHLKIVSNDGTRFSTAKEDLEKLRREYISLTSKYSAKHPAVLAMKRQVESLEEEVDAVQSFDLVKRQIRNKEQELAVLRKKYSEKHPEIIQLNREIDNLNDRLGEVALEDGMFETSADLPDNPGYIQIETQVASTELEIAEAERVYAELKNQFLKFQRRVVNTPQVEQEYKVLLRDYENAQMKYQDVNTRLLSAREAKGLEQSQLAERFTLIDPPIVPEKPIRPNRLALVFVGFVLSIGVGIGIGTFLEFMDRSIRRPEELSNIVKYPVLVIVPYWETEAEARSKIRKKWGSVLAVFSIIVLSIAGVHFFYMPLDIIAVKIVRKLVLNF